MRAILTGALAGAQVGLSGIPQHLLDGLEDSAQFVAVGQPTRRTGSPEVNAPSESKAAGRASFLFESGNAFASDCCRWQRVGMDFEDNLL